MSTRRSARISSNAAATPPSANGTTNGEAKYMKVTENSKKRKSRASASSSSEPAKENKGTNGPSFLSGIIEPNSTESDFAVPSLPATPVQKRRKAAQAITPAAPPPLTPTPSGVGLVASTSLASSTAAGNYWDEKPRPAEPHATNAPLSTPGGSRVTAYSSSPIKSTVPTASQENVSPTKKKAKDTVPPDVGVLMPPTSTTDTLLQDACDHLCKVDPNFMSLIDKFHCKMFSPEGLREVVDPFTALSSGIMGQQVSGQAAASIRKKFTALFPTTHPSFPTPTQVLTLPIPTLRTAGLSQRKAEYITGLAEKFVSGELSAQMLVSANDEELIEKLVAVRGLGRWSVEMFACFGLKRMDVFSTGDLGVQRGMAAYVGRDVSKLKNKGGKWKYMSEQDMLSIAAKFSPYRSLFMWYMWRIEEVDISVLQAE